LLAAVCDLAYWILFLPTSIIMFISMRFLRLMNVEITNSEKVFSKVDLEHYVQDMNERIKELILQCGAWNQVYSDKLLLIDEHVEYEKLAKLVAL
jgi:hypothetical protein